MNQTHKFGDHIDTDVIIPARYLNVSEPKLLAAHCMEDIDATFSNKVVLGDIIVAGYNFGCGSSREHAPIAIKAVGIQCVIAKSFARIFFRNAFNIGLPLIESEEIVNDYQEHDKLRINFKDGVVINERLGKTYQIPKFPPFMMDIISCGGLVEFTRRQSNHV